MQGGGNAVAAWEMADRRTEVGPGWIALHRSTRGTVRGAGRWMIRASTTLNKETPHEAGFRLSSLPRHPYQVEAFMEFLMS